MEEMFLKKLYRLISASLCFGITLTFIRILPLEYLDYSLIYDVLAILCGFLVAIVLIYYSRLKALCVALALFIMYFLFFKVPFTAAMVALCAFVSQILSLYLLDKIKNFLILISFSIILFIAYSSDSMRLVFLLHFVFWWHILWFVLLFFAVKIAQK